MLSKIYQGYIIGSYITNFNILYHSINHAKEDNVFICTTIPRSLYVINFLIGAPYTLPLHLIVETLEPEILTKL